MIALELKEAYFDDTEGWLFVFKDGSRIKARVNSEQKEFVWVMDEGEQVVWKLSDQQEDAE